MHKYTKQQSPCFECTERHMGCHSECEKYKQFRAEREEVSRQRILNQAPTDYSIKTLARIKKLKQHMKGK